MSSGNLELIPSPINASVKVAENLVPDEVEKIEAMLCIVEVFEVSMGQDFQGLVLNG